MKRRIATLKEPKVFSKKAAVRIIALSLCLLMVAATIFAAVQGFM